ncbi:hypothetical protein ACFVUS_31170 [Nocardia sp. NPDC058058]|uniref:hypothetical protein n=1 Tax=Nocardia sp. NPDC058058 TaxID=3346317 RepID=UPI0036DCBE17
MVTDGFAELSGLEVEQIWVWNGWLRLVFDLAPPGEPDTYMDLNDFQFTDTEGRNWDVRTEDDPRTAGPVLGLLRCRLATAQEKDRVLTLLFDNGARIVGEMPL